MVSYDADEARTFYDAYGSAEWDRLDATAYGRLKAIIHAEWQPAAPANGSVWAGTALVECAADAVVADGDLAVLH